MATKRIKTKISANNFHIFISLPLTKEKYKIGDIQPNTKVIEIKKRLELLTGIPMNLQRLFYLDREDLRDSSDLRSSDVVMAAILNLRVWSKWEKTVFNSFIGNHDGIVKSKNPVIDTEEFYKSQLSTALFVSANKGKKECVELLIKEGANVNWATNLGRTALHAAAATGKSNCIDSLLGSGADADMVDFAGKTPAMVANEYGHRASEKQLFLFQWQKRADCLKLDKTESNLMMHQQFDSGHRTWLKGKAQQIYMCKTLPAGEFIGTGIDAPRLKLKLGGKLHSMEREITSENSIDHVTDGNGFSLSKVHDTDVGPSATENGKDTYQRWLERKNLETKTKTMANDKEEVKLRNSKSKERSSQSFEREPFSHLKRSQKRITVPTEKLGRRADVYDDNYDFVPLFEQQFLRSMEP